MMEMNVTSVLYKTRQSGEASSSGGSRSISDGGGGDSGGGRNDGRGKGDGGDKDDGEGGDVSGSDDSGDGGACGYSNPVELEAGRMTAQVLGHRHTHTHTHSIGGRKEHAGGGRVGVDCGHPPTVLVGEVT